ncbi:MAG: hypothetical protein JSW47_15855, partial [Phycisphaerales bacterium]
FQDTADDTPVTIGCVDSTNNEHFVGSIDDVRIYNVALTAEEIKGVMIGEFPRASGPDPDDGALQEATWVTLTWKPGTSAVSHDVYFGDNFEDVNDGTGDTFRGNRGDTTFIAGFPGFPYPDGLVPGTTYYWRIDEVNDSDPNSPWRGDVWSFSIPSTNAYAPSPSDGAMFVDMDPILTWEPGLNSKLHSIVFGDNRDEVENAPSGSPVVGTSFTPGTLEVGKTYYWRVDEFNPPTTVKGDVWSFTTTVPGLGTAVMDRWENIATTDLNTLKNDLRYPNNPDVTETVDSFLWNGADLDEYGARIEGWLYVPATGDYTFWLNTDDQGELWLSTDDDSSNAVLIAQESSYSGFGAWGSGEEQSDPIPLIGGEKYYIMALWKEGGGGDHCQVAWQGSGIPDRTVIPGTNLSPFEPMSAFGARPANRAIDVRQTPILQWKPGLAAASHELYFGTDADAVANATKASPQFVGTRQLGAETYEPAMLAWNTNYYWRIDEVNNVNPESPWIGKVWSFTTADFGIIDDFEFYNDIPANEAGSRLVYVTWKDGYENPNLNGSTMGYVTGESLESDNVHGGNKSAPFQYNNTTASVSEVTLTLTPAQDWTANGIQVLSIWFYGDPANTLGQLYAKINGVQVNYDGEISNLRVPAWQVWNIDLATVGVSLQAVTGLAIGIQGGSAAGTLLLDDIRLYGRAGGPTGPVLLSVPKMAVAPVIDGQWDNVWNGVDETRCLITDMINTSSATPENIDDLSAVFKAAYDDNNFYVFVEVRDSVIDYEFSNWQGDGVEIYFDGDISRGSSYDGVNDNQIRITVDDVALADTDSSLPIDGSVFKVLLTDAGYNIEASFPLARLQISPLPAHNIIGFEMQINDNDGGGGRETILRWHSDDNNSWQDPSLFGVAQLTGRVVGP